MTLLNPVSLCGVFWLAWANYWGWASRSVNRTKESEGFWLRLQHVLPTVFGMFLIFRNSELALIPLSTVIESAYLRYFGSAVTGFGLLFTLWARMHLGKYWSGIITLKEGHRLIQTGPYKLVRHPIYTGFLAASLGSAIASGTADAFLGFVIIVVTYVVKKQREEVILLRAFGAEYEAFQKRTPSLIPFYKR